MDSSTSLLISMSVCHMDWVLIMMIIRPDSLLLCTLAKSDIIIFSTLTSSYLWVGIAQFCHSLCFPFFPPWK
jgi:hypothetical protein